MCFFCINYLAAALTAPWHHVGKPAQNLQETSQTPWPGRFSCKPCMYYPPLASSACAMDHRTCAMDHRTLPMGYRTCSSGHNTWSTGQRTCSMGHRIYSMANEHVRWPQHLFYRPQNMFCFDRTSSVALEHVLWPLNLFYDHKTCSEAPEHVLCQ